MLFRSVYKTREHGELTLTGLPENIHTLSVSIAGKDFIPVAESNILLQKNQAKKQLPYSGKFIPEYEGHIVTGKIIDNQSEKYVSDDVLSVPGLTFPGDGIRFFAGQKAKDGEVLFFTSGISGMKEIASTVFHSGERYRVDILSPFEQQHISKQMPKLQVDSAYYDQLLARSVALQVMHYFSRNSDADQNISESFFKTKPNWSFILDEYTRFTDRKSVV